MVKQISLALHAKSKGMHLITDEILRVLPELPAAGLLHVFIQHTSAGLCLNENADPTVRADLDQALDQLAPEDAPYYQHTMEGSDDMPAHIKSVLVGSSVSLPISQGKLQLGTWQGIYLCEFRREAPGRNLVVTLIT
jgi:secondary thiamine-phosphate synthase enzyme